MWAWCNEQSCPWVQHFLGRRYFLKIIQSVIAICKISFATVHILWEGLQNLKKISNFIWGYLLTNSYLTAFPFSKFFLKKGGIVFQIVVACSEYLNFTVKFLALYQFFLCFFVVVAGSELKILKVFFVTTEESNRPIQLCIILFTHCQFSKFSFIPFPVIFLVKNHATRIFSWNRNFHF